MDNQVKKHKNIARFVAILGILPGAWFLLATRTEIGQRLNIGCGYWMVSLLVLTAIWVMYAILTKILLKDISIAHDNAQSLNEQRHYKLAHISTLIEALLASAIILLSLAGFALTDFTCLLEGFLEGRYP